jgi:hypothetical protein
MPVPKINVVLIYLLLIQIQTVYVDLFKLWQKFPEHQPGS